MLSYVENSSGPYHATADDLVVLRDAGVPQPVIAAIVRHPSARPIYVQQTQPTAPVAVVPEVTETNEPVTTNSTAVIVTSNVQPTTVVVQQPATTTVVTQPPAVIQSPDLVVFRESLDPFGRWIDVPGHGLCWQPTVAVRDRNWRPYHSAGRWIYSTHGWYWLSDYSWGWAAFHYGRWNRSSYGWVWVPGYDWGPAWVSWRHGRDYIGWAPLPPHAHYDRRAGFRFRGSRVSVRFEWGLGYNDYTFCRPSHFYHRTPYRHYLARSRNVNIYNQTTVVNNFNTSGGNATPANTSISVQAVQQASGTEVRRVQVLSNSTGTRTTIRPDRLVSNGQSLAVYRPPTIATETRQPVRASSQATPVTRIAQPQRTVGSSSVKTSTPVRRSTTTVSTATPRREIRPARKVESRTIFVETVPTVRRPASRPTGASSKPSATPSRTTSPTRTIVSTPKPAPAPPTTTIPTRNSRQATPSRSTGRAVPTPTPRTTVRTTRPTTVPSRTPTVSRSVAAPPAVSVPSRTVIRTTPSRTVAGPTVNSRPTARPSARPNIPAARPTARPTPTAPPPAPKVTSSPARQPASTSGSKSSSGNESSGRPGGRPTARPGGN